jgi:glycosyltransferase involved in cell wall biosynthesis
MALDLTIAILARNEERNLASCLQAISSDLARQVVVIDSVSTDVTAAVAGAHGAEFIQFHWDGRFPRKLNWYLRHHTPATT